jgi:hypothetical protein
MDRSTGHALLSAALLLVAPVLPRHAVAMPPGYFVDSTAVASEDLPPDQVEADGDFTLSIHRHCDGPVGERLLNVAEATYPPRDRLVSRAIERGTEVGSDSARTSLWWIDGLGVSRVPYAVTAGALRHYAGLTDKFRRHNFWGAWDHNLFWTELRYDASIGFRESYPMQDSTLANVYVAEMSLAWAFDDGTFLPVFLAHRVVVLSQDGSVISVEGDGDTKEMVYFSSHRGIGHFTTLAR